MRRIYVIPSQPKWLPWQWYILLFLFQVYDATAKIPSGLLNGNVNQFGDFDECVEIQGSEGIQGQYCLTYLQLSIDESRLDLKHLHRLLHSHYAFRSNISDVSTYMHIIFPVIFGLITQLADHASVSPHSSSLFYFIYSKLLKNLPATFHFT